MRLAHLSAKETGIFFSKRLRASVLIPSLLPVYLKISHGKLALSSTIFLVVSETDDSFPPIIHPRARIFSLSAITISFSSSSYSLLSRARNFSHNFANLITIAPFTLSLSKQ